VTSDQRHELVRLRRERRALRMERDLLSRAAAFFAGGTSSQNRRSHSSIRELASFPFAFMCDRLGVSHAGYCAWRARQANPTARMVGEAI
jgi:hypothetical protein